MMGFLLFNPAPSSIAMIGLGGGSIAKYCQQHLPDAHFTAVEINEKVIALREQFHITPDNERFMVIHQDGANFVANRSHRFDVMLVDAFDSDGHIPRLCSAGFYDNCFSRLNEQGVLVVNVLSNDLKYGKHLSHIRDAFEDRVIMVNAEEDANKIVFACKGMVFPVEMDLIMQRVIELAPLHPIPLQLTAQKILQRMSYRTPRES